MKKTAHRARVKKEIKNKLKIKRSPFSFWNYLGTVDSAVLPYLDPATAMTVIPPISSFFHVYTKDKFCSFLSDKRRILIDTIEVGSLIACVLTSRHHQYFPLYKKMPEIATSKIRTFFGHFVQQRNRGKFSSILVRVLIAGEFFLFRFFIYAPNILSFFPMFGFTGNRRSSFLFKVRCAQEGRRKSRKIRQR